MKSTDLIKELTAAGCELKRHNGGSHHNRKNFSGSAPQKGFTSRHHQIH